MRSIVALGALLFGLTGCDSGEPAVPQKAHRTYEGDRPVVGHSMASVVALVKDNKEGKAEAFCAGVWVTKNTVLTARHCIAAHSEVVYALYSEAADEDMPDLDGIPFKIRMFEFDFFVSGVSRAANGTNELALIEVAHPPTHAVARVAKRHPKTGDRLHIVGHPDKHEFTYTTGFVSREIFYIDLANNYVHATQVAGTGMFGGSSGGGAFDEYGNLVGICTAISQRVGGQVYFVNVRTIQDFLTEQHVPAELD